MTLLSELTTLRLGGPAGRVVEARKEDEVVAAVAEADAAGEPLLVLAGGSNVVVADDGFPGTVVRVLTTGVARDGDSLSVAAGETWDPFVARCVEHDRAGIECLSGIPGSVGATPIQNVGAYGQDVSEAVRRVRRRKGMVIDPGDPDSVSAGSFFTNPILDRDEFERLETRVRERLGDSARPPQWPEPDGRVKTSAAWLVERAGYARGYGAPGPIAVSDQPPLAITN